MGRRWSYTHHSRSLTGTTSRTSEREGSTMHATVEVGTHQGKTIDKEIIPAGARACHLERARIGWMGIPRRRDRAAPPRRARCGLQLLDLRLPAADEREQGRSLRGVLHVPPCELRDVRVIPAQRDNGGG